MSASCLHGQVSLTGKVAAEIANNSVALLNIKGTLHRDESILEILSPVLFAVIYCSYNKSEDDFLSLKEYNDYLEEVETISRSPLQTHFISPCHLGPCLIRYHLCGQFHLPLGLIRERR